MTKDEVIERLGAHNIKLKSQKHLGNDTGEQLIFEAGEIVNVYNNGKCVPQGKNTQSVKQILSNDLYDIKMTKDKPRKVFVVYGHDMTARTQLEAMLRRWDIEPLILDQLPSEGQTIIEKLENYTQQAHYAIVLTTPDDEGYAINKVDERQYRARQNVVLELGMLLAKLGRERVAILIKDQKDLEKPSDISGLVYISFTDNVEEGKTQLYKKLLSAGFSIDPQKL